MCRTGDSGEAGTVSRWGRWGPALCGAGGERERGTSRARASRGTEGPSVSGSMSRTRTPATTPGPAWLHGGTLHTPALNAQREAGIPRVLPRPGHSSPAQHGPGGHSEPVRRGQEPWSEGRRRGEGPSSQRGPWGRESWLRRDPFRRGRPPGPATTYAVRCVSPSEPPLPPSLRAPCLHRQEMRITTPRDLVLRLETWLCPKGWTAWHQE